MSSLKATAETKSDLNFTTSDQVIDKAFQLFGNI